MKGFYWFKHTEILHNELKVHPVDDSTWKNKETTIKIAMHASQPVTYD